VAVESYHDRLPLIYCWQPDLGFRAARARNMGIARATADVLIFLDDDCIIQDKFIESHVAIQAADNMSIGIGHRRNIKSLAHSTNHIDADVNNRGALAAYAIHHHPYPWKLVYSHNLSIPRLMPEAHFDDQFEGWGAEDTDLGFRLWRAGGRLIPVPRAEVLHVEAEAPRDPFRREDGRQQPDYRSFLQNILKLLDKFPNDPELKAGLLPELRGYIKHENQWVRDGRQHDPEIVIKLLRSEAAPISIRPVRAHERKRQPDVARGGSLEIASVEQIISPVYGHAQGVRNTAAAITNITLSVVVPTRKRAAALERLLTVLEPQLHGHHERSLVVVNDGSHDADYEAVIGRFAGMLDYVVLPQHRGIIAARNAGARRAAGDFLVCTDDDCAPPPDWLDTLAATIAANPDVDAVFGSVCHLARPSAGLIERYMAITRAVSVPRRGAAGYYEGVSANMAMRHDLFEKLGGFDGRLGDAGGEDIDFCYRAAAAGAGVVPASSWITYHAHDFGLPKLWERFRRFGRGVVRHRIFVGERTDFWSGKDGSLFRLLINLPWLRYAPERPLIAAAHCGWVARRIFYALMCLQTFAYQWGARTELRARWQHIANIAEGLRRPPSPAHDPKTMTVKDACALSVVIPTHGRPAELDWLLHRLREQVAGNPHRRIIVVNDGSHDGRYAAVIERYRDVVDYVVMPKNRGPAAARNLGAARVADGYLVFIDDDCEPPAYWLDWLAAIIAEYPDADAIGGITRPLPSAPDLLSRFLAEGGFYPMPQLLDGKLLMLVSANLAVRCSVFQSVGGFDETMITTEDRNLTYRLIHQGAICHLDSGWFVYHDMTSTLGQHFRRYYRYGVGIGRELELEDKPPDRNFWPAKQRPWHFWLERIRRQFRQARRRRWRVWRPWPVRAIYILLAAMTMLTMDLGFVAGKRRMNSAARSDRQTLDFIRTTRCRNIAEIGVNKGHASLQFARFLNGKGELHLYDHEDRVAKVLKRLEEEGYRNVSGFGSSRKLADSYCWSLGQVIAQNAEPIYDYIVIDGAHSWAQDAPAALLADRLLKIGGYLDFADCDRTLADSPVSNPRGLPSIDRLYTSEQIAIQQVKMVIDLLIRRDRRYREIEPNKIFQKISDLPEERVNAMPFITSRSTSEPIVSCLTVTRGRPELLRRAVACFRRQTVAAELVVLYEEDDARTAEYVESIQDSTIRGMRVEAGMKLGTLRNLSVANARAPFVAQWDDDDWYAPERLQTQLDAIEKSGKAGCLLSRWTVYDVRSATAYISTTRTWEGSLVVRRDALTPYDSTLSRGEDMRPIQSLLDRNQLVLLDRPDLYIYVYHGGNTYDPDHWGEIIARSQKLPEIQTRLISAKLAQHASIEQ
jgi:glycosyltransferase involved in cell wall biosynthesis